VDGVGHHLSRHAALHSLAIAVRPGGDALGGDLLLVAIERDAVDRIRRSAPPDRLVRREAHLRDALRSRLVEQPLGDDVQERARVLGLVGLHHVEPVVLEPLLERRLDGIALRWILARELLVHVFENVLPRGLRRGGRAKNQE
jgi:hypothetical protein